MKVTSSVVIACFLSLQTVGLLPRRAQAASPAEDLKKIEYKYYFRGNYTKAIAELRAFLERRDIGKTEIIEAREYLAASLILSNSAAEGRGQFIEILKTDGAYDGPDPSLFKPEIVAAFREAKAEYASVVIRSVPEGAAGDVTAATETAASKGKPIYKKWWFYTGMAAVLLLVAGATGSGADAEQPPKDTGSLTVEVDVP